MRVVVKYAILCKNTLIGYTGKCRGGVRISLQPKRETNYIDFSVLRLAIIRQIYYYSSVYLYTEIVFFACLHVPYRFILSIHIVRTFRGA